MNQKHKSVYTHTHTHTHTISFVCHLRMLCGTISLGFKPKWVLVFCREVTTQSSIVYRALALDDYSAMGTNTQSALWINSNGFGVAYNPQYELFLNEPNKIFFYVYGT